VSKGEFTLSSCMFSLPFPPFFSVHLWKVVKEGILSSVSMGPPRLSFPPRWTPLYFPPFFFFPLSLALDGGGFPRCSFINRCYFFHPEVPLEPQEAVFAAFRDQAWTNAPRESPLHASAITASRKIHFFPFPTTPPPSLAAQRGSP